MYAVTRAMMTFFSAELRRFILRIAAENIFGRNILNLVVRLNFYSLLPSVILYDLFAQQHNGDNLREAVGNFSESTISETVKFLCLHVNLPERLIEKIRECEFFRDFTVDLPKSRWSEKTVKEFLCLVCETAGIAIPDEALPLIVRVRVDAIMPIFFRGEIELPDFYQMCINITMDKPELMLYCISYVGKRSNNLAQFMSEVRNIPFSPNPEASDFVPHCLSPLNRALHGLACGQATAISNHSAAIEFGVKLEDTSCMAVHYHRSKISGKSECTLITFRFRNTAFLYSRRQSSHFYDTVKEALVQHVRMKPVFVFRLSEAKEYLEKAFRWLPQNLVDASELAKRDDIRPSMPEMVKSLVGGEFCRRALQFTDTAWPSPAAIRHLDIAVSVLYEFGIKGFSLRGQDQETRDTVVVQDPRKRKHHESGHFSSSSSLSRSRLS